MASAPTHHRIEPDRGRTISREPDAPEPREPREPRDAREPGVAREPFAGSWTRTPNRAAFHGFNCAIAGAVVAVILLIMNGMGIIHSELGIPAPLFIATLSVAVYVLAASAIVFGIIGILRSPSEGGRALAIWTIVLAGASACIPSAILIVLGTTVR